MSEQYRPGRMLDGVVTRVEPYGAFIRLPDGRTGLVHISKMGRYIENIHDYFERGQEVTVRVLRDAGERIHLAMKPARTFRALEPMLQSWKKRSAERLQDRDLRLKRRGAR